MDQSGSSEPRNSLSASSECNMKQRLENELLDLPLERLKSAQVQDMVVQQAISIVISRQKSEFSAKFDGDYKEGESSEVGSPESSEGDPLS